MNLPLGYRYATAYAGIRKEAKDDVALIVSGIPASGAAVFTQNRAQAAPVRLARRNLRTSRGKVGAVLINAGNANCATRTGDRVAAMTTQAVARMLKLPANQVLPASTGVIGVELDASLIAKALPGMVKNLSESGFEAVANAILTTDLVMKTASAELQFRRGRVRIAGMTKGSGMIHPRMATTLGFVLTDAQIAASVLQKILTRAVERSFNRISVDGDTSTNDTLALLANGASGFRPDPTEMGAFEAAVTEVMQSLAQQIVRDGEGARKLIMIEVRGTANDADAVAIARTVANSPLVKTAVAGSDANWGRILCAAGNAGVAFDAKNVDISLQRTAVCRAGLAAAFDESALKTRLDETDCLIELAIRGRGKGTATFWTCDFTEGYIRINASYRS